MALIVKVYKGILYIEHLGGPLLKSSPCTCMHPYMSHQYTRKVQNMSAAEGGDRDDYDDGYKMQ